MKLEEIRIHGADREPVLAGLRYIPENDRKPVCVALAHGFTSAKHSMDNLAAYLAERGYECVTFDAVGHKLGCSGGEMLRISQAADNLSQTIGWMRASLVASRMAIIGHSMGAAAAIYVAALEQQANPNAAKPLRGIACLCMGLHPMDGFETVLGAAMLKQRADYVSGAPARELLSGLDKMLESAAKLGGLPALLIAARSDVLLPVRSVETLGKKIGPSAEVRIIEAMHLDAPDKSRGVLFNWLERLG